MPPPRSIRVLNAATCQESCARDVQEAMKGYEDAYQVRGMLRVLMTKLLEEQPLDPISFLAQTVKQDDELDAFAKDAKANRFDLRRECTKKRELSDWYSRLLALQQQHQKHHPEDTGTHRSNIEVSREYLLEQLESDDMHAALRSQFPKHYRDLEQWFHRHERDLPSTLSRSWFLKQGARVLSQIGSM